MNKMLWHNLPIDEVLELLKTDKKGLSKDEVERRLKKYGLNKLPVEKKLSWFFILLSQFKSPLIYILLIAALVSFFLKEYADLLVILAVVLINTIVGFIQENKAENTLAHLKKMISYKSKILRNGMEMYIDSSKISLGDILLLDAGDRVPADGRIFELNNLQINEASLTGESMPINKELEVLDKGTNLADRKNMVFMGTVVTRGRAKVIVTGIGVKTQIGEIAALVKETKDEKTPLQLKLEKFSKKLAYIILLISLFIFAFGVLMKHDVFEMFETAIAVAVAAIPEGLIVSVTVILTLGMQKILRKKALIRKLIAAETLGSISVICTDKTGTLTEGLMRVDQLLTGCCDLKNDLVQLDKKGFKSEIPDHYQLLNLGIICNNTIISSTQDGLSEEFIGDSTETALLKAGIDAGLDYKKVREENKRLAEIPFSTEIKYMATLNVKDKANNIIYLKGAPEKVLDFCSYVLIKGEEKKITPDLKKDILNNLDKLTSQGLRVLAGAYKIVAKNKKDLKEEDISASGGNKFVFLGIFALKDPLRKEAKSTIEICKKAGIRPVIITGDHRLTVKAIAQEIGLQVANKNILEGHDLDKMSDDDLKERVKEITVYARVSPKHKLRIVDAWQSHGEVVAMLGDGVNDAPALKTADIGVALGSGTDVAKEIADIVLLDDNFKTIVDAVKQGRAIFDNIRKIIVYLLAASFSEIILIGGALLLGLPLPILALQILYINIVTDGFPSVSLSFEPGEKDVMQQKPRKKDEPLLNTEMKFLIFIIGIITDLILFGVYFYLLKRGADMVYIRTFIFTALAVASLFYIFSCKSLRKSIWHINIFSNKYLVAAVLFGFALQLFALYTPFMREIFELTILGLKDWLWLIGFGFLNITAIEIGKYIFIHKKVKS